MSEADSAQNVLGTQQGPLTQSAEVGGREACLRNRLSTRTLRRVGSREAEGQVEPEVTGGGGGVGAWYCCRALGCRRAVGGARTGSESL